MSPKRIILIAGITLLITVAATIRYVFVWRMNAAHHVEGKVRVTTRPSTSPSETDFFISPDEFVIISKPPSSTKPARTVEDDSR